MTRSFRVLFGFFLTLHAAISWAQGLSLHEQIDQLILEQSPLTVLPVASDAEFLRRVSLDLSGMPPAPEAVRAFLADPAADKRAQAVERLFASPLFERRLAETLDIMLMERRPNIHVSQDVWMAWLLQSVREDKSWNLLAKEILGADGLNGARPAVRFYLDRGAEPHLLTRDVGRVFFGRDLQCAQCHDHPLISDYLESDYQGMLAIFAAGYEIKVTQNEQEIACYAERSGSDVEFESVFFKGTKHLTGARILTGREMIEPMFLPGADYLVAPAEKTVSVPQYSRRHVLANMATNGQNRAFNENIANRLWAMVMGRGLVQPVDLQHSENPAAHPALLKVLGEQFAASGFKMRGFLKELVLTQAYQRAWEVPQELTTETARAAEIVAALEAQSAALAQAASQSQAEIQAALKAYQATETVLMPAVVELNAVRTKYLEQEKKVAEAAKLLQAAQTMLEGKVAITTSVAEAAITGQAAASKLPEDAELAAAAAKFVERAAQLQAEVAALQTNLQEQQAGHAAQVAAQVVVKVEVEAAQQKVQPLREAAHQQEALLVAARQQGADAATANNRQQSQLASLRTLASLKSMQDQLANQATVLTHRASELAGAQANLTEYANTVVSAEQQLTSATTAMTAATATLTNLTAAHARLTEVANSVNVAFQSTALAQQNLPEDAVLMEAAAKLKERAAALALDLATHQQQVDTAAQLRAGTQQQTAALQVALDQVLAENVRREEVHLAAASALTTAQQDAEQQQLKLRETRTSVTLDWSHVGYLTDLQALTPEQLCWSIFQTTGVYERYRQIEIAELDKTAPLNDAAKQDPVQVAARERDIEQRTYDQLKGNLGIFVTNYGAAAGQPQGEFFATVDQALFAANGGPILSWIAPTSGNVTERIAIATEPQQAAEELYLTVFSRPPQAEEVAAVSRYLAARPEQKLAVAQELVWSLLTSSEFRFNH